MPQFAIKRGWVTAGSGVSARFAAAIVVAVSVFFASWAGAIDPDRRLTQCVQRIWQVQQGLPTATILSVRQTGDGYLWLGTPEGLVRFDGVRFTTIGEVKPAVIARLRVQDLCEDHEHRLWLATEDSGLICLSDAATSQSTIASQLPSLDVRCVIASRTAGIWAATAGGLASVADRLTIYRREQGLMTDDVRALCEARDGKLWIGGQGNKIGLFDGSKFSTIELHLLPADITVFAIAQSQDESMWIGTSHGLIRIQDGAEHLFSAANGLADDLVYCLARGRNNTIWAGTQNGFSRIQADEIDSFRSSDGLSQSTVTTLFEDREGTLWVGTKHGLNQFLDRRTLPFTTREGLPSNDTGPVFQDSSGNLWVGTLGAGLARFDGRRFTVLNTDAGLPSDTIYALADGDHGQLWVGTDRGLSSLRNGQFEKSYGMEDGLPSNVVRALLRTRDAALWIGTDAGLCLLREGKFAQPEGDPSLLKAPIKFLTEAADGSLVAATDGAGILRSAGGRLAAWDNPKLPHGNFEALFVDNDGWFWISSPGDGIFLFDGQNVVHLTTKDGLYDDEICGIAADDDNRIWMACSNGIFFVLRSEVRQLLAGKLKRLKNTPFNPMDSLRTAECQRGVQPTVCKTADGRLYFSTTRGLIMIDPERLQRALPPIPVVIERMIAGGQRQNLSSPVNLPPGKTNLEFDYGALSFTAPTRITFRYKLDGFDNDWVEAGSRREAFYTNLAPGNYQFHVAAANGTGDYQEANRPIAFSLSPYLYQRWWFFPACGVGVLLAGWGIYRLRVQHIKHRLQAVVAERSRIARELHDTLMQGFSGVTMQLQALLASLPPSPERRTLADIIQDAAASLRDARRSIAGLRSDRGQGSGLSVAIAQAARQLTETQDLALKLKLDDDTRQLPEEVKYNLLRIAQEAISNAVKHAGARTLEVSFEVAPRGARLVVRDDGAGMPDSNGSVAQPGHYGLIGMKERASQIGADLKIQTAPGRGTMILVDVPLELASQVIVESPREAAADASRVS